MKRKLFVLLTVLAILFCIAVPAFAVTTEINIWDYAEIEVDGTSKVVTINLPTSWLTTGIFNSNWTQLYSQSGSNTAFDLSNIDFANGNLYVGFFPLGTSYNPYANVAYSGRSLDVSDLPNGSVISFSVRAEIQNASSESTNVFGSRFGVGQVLNNGDNMKNTLVATALSGNFPVYSSYHEYVLADNSAPLIFNQFFLITSSGPASRWIFSMEYFTITTTIDALQQLADATGETNRLLDAVNKKLDDIIDYVPQPSDPSGGLGDAFDDAEQDVLDKVENGRDQIVDIIDEFGVYLEEFLPGIVVVSNWLNVLLELKFIRVLLFFSLAFGMCGLFLGVANSFRGKS